MKKQFFYGWVVVFGALIVLGIFWGTLASFGVFLKPISQDIGLTRAATSAAFSILFVVYGSFGILGGWLTDKYGPRLVVITGAIMAGVGYFLMSQITASWQLYVFFGVVVAIGQSVYWTPPMAIVSRWFTKQRALALGLVLMGLGVGQMTVPPLMASIINNYGWHKAYVAMAVLIWMFVIPVAMLMKSPPHDIRPLNNNNVVSHNVEHKRSEPVQLKEWSGRQAARTLPFWLLVIINFAVSCSLQILLVHIVPYATDVGISATTAALIITVMGFSGILARFLSGLAAVKVGNKSTLLFCLILQTLNLFGLIEARSLWMFCIMGGLFNFGFSGCAPLTLSMVGEYFGLSSVGVIIGLTSFAWALGGAIGPYFAGYIFDVTNSYSIAFAIAGVIMIIAVWSAYVLKPGTK